MESQFHYITIQRESEREHSDHYHNDTCFGLGKNDSSLLLKGKKSDWVPPTADGIAENAEHVSNLSTMIGQESTD